MGAASRGGSPIAGVPPANFAAPEGLTTVQHPCVVRVVSWNVEGFGCPKA